MPTTTDLRSSALAALNLEITADPGVLQANLGSRNYRLMDRTCRRLRQNGGNWCLLGKTQGDTGKVVPPDWRPITVDYRGQRTTLAGVSHDVLMYAGRVTLEPGGADPAYPFGMQIDLLGGANHTDNSIGTPATINGGVIPSHDYRITNPPIAPGQWLSGENPQPGPTPTPQPPAQINFPPRDETFGFGLTLNQNYKNRGRPADGTLGGNHSGDSRHTDLEGEMVWMSEYLRLRLQGQNHLQASEAVLRMVDDAWPK